MKIIYLIFFLCLFYFSCAPGRTEKEVMVKITTNDKLSYNDDFIEIHLKKSIYNCIKGNITNNSDSTVFVDFDYSTFIDNKNKVYQLISGSTRIYKIEDAQRIMVVPPKARYEASFYPRELVDFTSKGFETRAIFFSAAKNNELTLNVAYRVGDKSSKVLYLKVPLIIVKVIDLEYPAE